MTIRTLTKFRNPDRTSDINERLSTLISKGVYSGGQVTPVAGSLAVDIQPLEAMGADGMVTVLEGTPERVSVTAGITQYVIMHAEYVANSAPIVEFEVLTQAELAALTSFQRAVRLVLATLDIPIGATEVDPDLIDLTESDRIDQLGRSFLRGSVDDVTDLPDYASPATGETTQNRIGDVYYVRNERLFYAWQDAGGAEGWLRVLSSAAEQRLDDHKQNLDDGTVAPDFFEAQHVTVAFRESHDEGSASAKTFPSEGEAFGAGNAIVDERYPVAVRTRSEFTGLTSALKVQLSGLFYVGKGAQGTANQYFRLVEAGEEQPYLGTDGKSVPVLKINTSTDSAEVDPLSDADDIGFYEDPYVYFDMSLSGDTDVNGSISVVHYEKKFLGQVTPEETISTGFFDVSVLYPGKAGAADLSLPTYSAPPSTVHGTLDFLLGESNKRVRKYGGDLIQASTGDEGLTIVGGPSSVGVDGEPAVIATGGTGTLSDDAGDGITATGGDAATGAAGHGILATGGDSTSGADGIGVAGYGGGAGGYGVQGIGGTASAGVRGVGGSSGAVGVDGAGTGGSSGVSGTGGPSGGHGVVGTGGDATGGTSGTGVQGTGGDNTGGTGGIGVQGTGGDDASGIGGAGVQGTGGVGSSAANSGVGVVGVGAGVSAGVQGTGADSTTTDGGVGVEAYGGTTTAGARDGGNGVYAEGGDGTAGGGYGIDALGGDGTSGGPPGPGGRFVAGAGTGGAYGSRSEGAGTGSGVVGIGGGTSGAGVDGTGGVPNGVGVRGQADGTGRGVWGIADAAGGGPGVEGNSSSGYGVLGTSNSEHGVVGTTLASTKGGVQGSNTASGVGAGSGVLGAGTTCYGVTAQGHASGGSSGRSSLRIVPQASDPNTGQDGDQYVNQSTGLPRSYGMANWNRGIVRPFALIGPEVITNTVSTWQEYTNFPIPADTMVVGSTIRFFLSAEVTGVGDGGLIRFTFSLSIQSAASPTVSLFGQNIYQQTPGAPGDVIWAWGVSTVTNDGGAGSAKINTMAHLYDSVASSRFTTYEDSTAMRTNSIMEATCSVIFANTGGNNSVTLNNFVVDMS